MSASREHPEAEHARIRFTADNNSQVQNNRVRGDNNNAQPSSGASETSRAVDARRSYRSRSLDRSGSLSPAYEVDFETLALRQQQSGSSNVVNAGRGRAVPASQAPPSSHRSRSPAPSSPGAARDATLEWLHRNQGNPRDLRAAQILPEPGLWASQHVPRRSNLQQESTRTSFSSTARSRPRSADSSYTVRQSLHSTQYDVSWFARNPPIQGVGETEITELPTRGDRRRESSSRQSSVDPFTLCPYLRAHPRTRIRPPPTNLRQPPMVFQSAPPTPRVVNVVQRQVEAPFTPPDTPIPTLRPRPLAFPIHSPPSAQQSSASAVVITHPNAAQVQRQAALNPHPSSQQTATTNPSSYTLQNIAPRLMNQQPASQQAQHPQATNVSHSMPSIQRLPQTNHYQNAQEAHRPSRMSQHTNTQQMQTEFQQVPYPSAIYHAHPLYPPDLGHGPGPVRYVGPETATFIQQSLQTGISYFTREGPHQNMLRSGQSPAYDNAQPSLQRGDEDYINIDIESHSPNQQQTRSYTRSYSPPGVDVLAGGFNYRADMLLLDPPVGVDEDVALEMVNGEGSLLAAVRAEREDRRSIVTHAAGIADLGHPVSPGEVPIAEQGPQAQPGSPEHDQDRFATERSWRMNSSMGQVSGVLDTFTLEEDS